MKTKRIFQTLMAFLIISPIWIYTVSATTYHAYLDNTYNPEYFYLCGGMGDTVIVHKPGAAVNNITWLMPPPTYQTIYWNDSVIVTYATQGNWYFSSNETGKDFYVYFISSQPAQPTCMAHDTTFCTESVNWTLNAENYYTGATYLWDNGATTQSRTITNIGTYWVRITNACGTRTDSIHVNQSNPNAPNLGADQSFCQGAVSILDPGSTNVASCQWSTGDASPTLAIDTSGTYWVYVVDNNGCSGRDTVQVTVLVPTGESICYVEFDTLTWKNKIRWTSDLPGNANLVRIFKETSLNVWTLIGTVPVGTTNFTDMTSDPLSQSYSYKIALVDTCGNESVKSAYHTTITLLSTYDAGTNTYGFTWSAYQGLTVSDYYLFGIDASNHIIQIATVPGNVYMYNYINPSLNYVKYFIGFETPDCNAKSNVIVKSNWVQSVITGIETDNMIGFKVFPNPAHDKIEVRIHAQNYEIEVLNIFGQVLLKDRNTKEIDISGFAPGTYILRVSGENFTIHTKIKRL